MLHVLLVYRRELIRPVMGRVEIWLIAQMYSVKLLLAVLV